MLRPCYNRNMPVALNSYATKIFAEHPIATWPLDDDAYYISLISDANRLFSNWTLTNCFAKEQSDPTFLVPDTLPPFLDETVSSFIGNNSSAMTLQAKSANIFNVEDLNEMMQTFCINLYLYQNPADIDWIKVGFQYYNYVTSLYVDVLSDEIPPPDFKSWVNFQNTYDVPVYALGGIKILVQVRLNSGSDEPSRTILMNGLSVGQWSEPVCQYNLGRSESSLPVSAGLDADLFGISGDQYGVLSDNCYYIIEDKKLLSQNAGPPIIFGTDNSTKIYESPSGNPSLIFPGKGMLNEKGRSNTYSLEFWMQIQPNTSNSRRIFGPLGNDYGIYVKEDFISLLIGNELASHPVEEWYRPMLINLSIKDNNATLSINGEEVISISYDKKNISLPTDTDWWGVYSYSDIDLFKIDCISIFPYPVSSQIGKRRFVLGQGTPSTQFLDDSFLGTPSAIDFSTAGYTSNIIYPDVARWDAAYFNNLSVNKNYLSVPQYVLPNVYIGENRSIQEWYSDNKIINNLEYSDDTHPKFITFRPNVTETLPPTWNINGNTWNSISYLNFNSLNILTEPISAFFGVFETEEDISEDRSLFFFENVLTGETCDIRINSDTITYYLNNVDFYSEVITVGNHFVVGFNIQLVSIDFGYDISNFFSSPSSIQVYVGGNKINTFEGKIYRVSFCNQINFQKIENHFLENGIVNAFEDELFVNHFASYTLLPLEDYNRFFLDIAVSSEWQEYFPLSYFASYVNDIDGNKVYDLDFLQINVGYHTIESFLDWHYQDLMNEYEIPTQKFYSDLSDDYMLYSYLRDANASNDIVDLSKSSLQMILTFQSILQENMKSLNDFQYTKNLSDALLIDADLENTILDPLKAYDTKFIFKDGVVVYPPTTYPEDVSGFNELALVVNMELNQKGILSNPLKVRNFEITSKALNADKLNPITTKFGNKIYPYTKEDDDINGKNKNPLAIYKKNTPYLYTTEKSGIKILQDCTNLKDFGAYIPINSSLSNNFNISALQMWMMYDDKSILTESKRLFEIEYFEGIIEFIFDADLSGKRIIISARDKSDPNKDVSWIRFYQNGLHVINPVISFGEWNCLGFSFDNPLNFSGLMGKINLFANFVYNNISYYLTEGLGTIVDSVTRVWNQIYESPPTIYNWSYWTGETWKTLYVISETTSSSITPEDIYKVYTGTNRNVIDDGDGLIINETGFSTYTNVQWQPYVKNTV